VDAAVVTLYRPAEHEPLIGAQWDEARVEDAIASIVAATEDLVDDAVWPVHPRDDEGGLPREPTTLYIGAAGVIWALHALGSRLDLDALISRALERWRARPDFDDVPSLWMGETGLLLVAHVVGPSATDDDRLIARIRENAQNETWELMWGSPGTTLAAREIGAQDAWRESAERLWAELGNDDLWTQHLYGRARRILGPAHGFAGNIHALRGVVPDDGLRARVARALERTVLREDGLANWPPLEDHGENEIRVQWCHGAPGLVATIGDLMTSELSLAAGELIWRAGPLTKGPGLCHGTAGNGYSFLKLYELTGDELWLTRARAFAMHALEQSARALSGHGQLRFTLWTGDLGVALYLRSCLEVDARVPTIDYW